jgi:unsaturated rhamnogalacturonyl hydrolase
MNLIFLNRKLLSSLFLMMVITGSVSCQSIRSANLWSVRMANSEMKRNPEAWTIDFVKTPRWNYTQGLVSLSLLELWQHTKNAKYYEYAKAYADKFIDENGIIATYKTGEYSLDRVNSGKILFILYKVTGEKKYKIAIDTLRAQLLKQPRTSDGGYWHKKVYPNQMWLDGLYMASPFLAQYAKDFNESEAFNEVALQILLIQKHTYDSLTNLNFHGWDESRQQQWADPKTGCSPHVWGRAQGWYFMALVDVLDFLPEYHPQRPFIISVLQNMAKSLAKIQDKNTGLWYQVLDQGNREGNYLEASASAMFTYAMLKSVRKGYLTKSYLTIAKNGYNGINKYLIRHNSDSTLSITRVCAVAGLGGDPYRDGSYEYYIHETIRDDDPKAVGPYILASIEFEQMERP